MYIVIDERGEGRGDRRWVEGRYMVTDGGGRYRAIDGR